MRCGRRLVGRTYLEGREGDVRRVRRFAAKANDYLRFTIYDLRFRNLANLRFAEN